MEEFVIWTYQNPTQPDTPYFWTGNIGGSFYPPAWSWRKDMAVRFPTEKIAKGWAEMLTVDRVTTNDGTELGVLTVEGWVR